MSKNGNNEGWLWLWISGLNVNLLIMNLRVGNTLLASIHIVVAGLTLIKAMIEPTIFLLELYSEFSAQRRETKQRRRDYERLREDWTSGKIDIKEFMERSRKVIK